VPKTVSSGRRRLQPDWVSSEVEPRARYERYEPCDEVLGAEEDVGGSVAGWESSEFLCAGWLVDLSTVAVAPSIGQAVRWASRVARFTLRVS